MPELGWYNRVSYTSECVTQVESDIGKGMSVRVREVGDACRLRRSGSSC